MKAIPRDFYQKDTLVVAKKLLGKRIVRKIGDKEMSAIITETEAYKHKSDPASHAFRRVTERNKVMFGDVGISYVYFTYGMHYCFNVVAKNPKTEAGAVLIRAAKPEKGIEEMMRNRNIKNFRNISDGPAKLAQALNITKKDYGIDLTKQTNLFIAEGIKNIGKISSSPRIGIKQATEKLWNFKITIQDEI